jgi:serine/threonine-protein kinase HipA
MIGTLLLLEDKIHFNYCSEFIAKNIQISPIKLDINQTSEIYTNNDSKIYQGMPGVFFDSLPDKFGMSFIDRYFESKGYSVKDITLLDRLSFIGDRGM